jgi:rod shape-determining protein MreD
MIGMLGQSHVSADPEPAPGRRAVLATGVVIAALVLQVAVANRLPLPGAVAPDLVLLAVVALALVNGPMPGLITGFAAGLAADIVPPADHAIGRYALVFCLIGYICGLVSEEMERSAVVPFLAVAVGALAGSTLDALVGMVLGDPRTSWEAVVRVLPLTVVYDVILSPFVIWSVLRLSRGSRRRGGEVLRVAPGLYRAR